MNHQPCQCIDPTDSCPRYGWMKGRKWQVCQGIGVDLEKRDALLDSFSGQPQPLQQSAKRRGLGDLIEAGLSAIGVKTVVENVLGPCGGCTHRKEVLNRIGRTGRKVIQTILGR